MKLSKSKLKQLIKEELNGVLRESSAGVDLQARTAISKLKQDVLGLTNYVGDLEDDIYMQLKQIAKHLNIELARRPSGSDIYIPPADIK